MIDNRTTIVEEVQESDSRIHSFLKDQIQQIIDRGMLTEVLIAHIHPLIIEERQLIIDDKIRQILES